MSIEQIKEFETILIGIGRSENTIRSYLIDLDVISLHLEEMSTKGLQSCIVRLTKSGYAAASIKRMLYAFKKYCMFMSIDIDFNKVSTPKVVVREKAHITDTSFIEGMRRVSASPSGTKYDSVFIINVFKVLYYTGLRLDELLTLSMKSYNKESNTIYIIGKGSKERRIPVHVTIQDLFSDRSFLDKLNAINKSTIHNWTKLYFGEEYSPHSFRHGFTTKLIKNGADQRTVKTILGHESFTTTLRYFHNDKEEIYEQALKALG